MTHPAPCASPAVPAASRLDQLKGLVGDLARPFAIIVTSGSAAWATVVIAYRVDGFESAGIYIGAVYAGLAGLYGFKAWENRGADKHAAEVEKIKAAPPVAAPEAPAGDGVLPADQRVVL